MRPYRLIACITILIAMTPLVTGCAGSDENSPGSGDAKMKQFELETVEKALNLHFPEATKIHYSYSEHGLDRMASMIVTLPEQQLTPFIAQSPLKDEAFSPLNQSYLGISDGDWNPGKFSPPLSVAQHLVSHSFVINMGYSVPDENQLVTVYLRWHTL